jgi:hypothetical protein
MAVVSLYVRNILVIIATSSLFVLFLCYRDGRIGGWTSSNKNPAGGSVRTATATDTALNEKPPPPTPPPTAEKRDNGPDHKPWPPLAGLISADGKSIEADVQFVLDFAIIGRTYAVDAVAVAVVVCMCACCVDDEWLLPPSTLTLSCRVLLLLLLLFVRQIPNAPRPLP